MNGELYPDPAQEAHEPVQPFAQPLASAQPSSELLPGAVLQENMEPQSGNVIAGLRGWADRHKWKIAGGVCAVSLLEPFATAKSESHTLRELAPVAGYTVGGTLAMEGLWCLGAGIAATSVGVRIKNKKSPDSYREAFNEFKGNAAKNAAHNPRFQAGFWINTTGAVGEFAIPAYAITTHLPPEAWGATAPFLIDLGLTVVVRKIILNAVKDAAKSETVAQPVAETTV